MTQPAQQPLIYFTPSAIPLGDGTYAINMGKPKFGRQSVSIREAAASSGLSQSTLVRLFLAGFIEGTQDSPRKIRLFVDSMEAHFRATQDPKFWTPARRQRFEKAI